MNLLHREFLKTTLACLALVLTAPVPAAENYRGFTVDDSRVRKLPEHAALITATMEQIDIVHDVSLPADILSFAQVVKLELVPTGTFRSPTPGRYSGRGEQSVQLSTGIVTTGRKPVLLHELMHAYHDQRIERGYGNRKILAYYQEAQGLKTYASKSHMMANEKEFFACAATAYLFGVTAQEPFRREKVREAQPGFHDYLKSLFGPDAGTFAGSLKRSSSPETKIP